jgi:hypothetical protein
MLFSAGSQQSSGYAKNVKAVYKDYNLTLKFSFKHNTTLFGRPKVCGHIIVPAKDSLLVRGGNRFVVCFECEHGATSNNRRTNAVDDSKKPR